MSNTHTHTIAHTHAHTHTKSNTRTHTHTHTHTITHTHKIKHTHTHTHIHTKSYRNFIISEMLKVNFLVNLLRNATELKSVNSPTIIENYNFIISETEKEPVRKSETRKGRVSSRSRKTERTNCSQR